MEINIREYRAGDEKGIFELFSRVYPDSVSDYDSWLKKWNWQFLQNPQGKSRIWLAMDGDRVAGQYPVIISKIKMGDRVNLAGQNIHLMVDPSYRGQRIFQRLEKLGIDELGKSGVRLVWGYPNKDSLKGHLNSGWSRMDQYSLLFRILNPFNFLGPRSGGEDRASSRGNFVRVKRFDDSCKGLIQGFTESKDFTTVRDIEYLNWRFDDSHGFKVFYHLSNGNVAGYLVYKIVRFKRFQVAYLFDLVYWDRAELKRMMREFYRQCGRDGAVAVLFPVMSSKLQRKELLRSGLYNYSFYSGMVIYGIQPPSQEKIDLRQFKEMYLTVSDLDFNG